MKNFIYLGQGAIGDFLMVLNLLEEYHQRFPKNKCFVFTSRNAHILALLAEEYPFVQVISIGKKDILTSFWCLFHTIFSENEVVLPPTFGQISFITRLAGFLLTLYPGSVLHTFYIGENPKKGQIFFDRELLFIENIYRVIPDCKYREPSFHFNEKIEIIDRYNLTTDAYIVLHPFAANPVRSLPTDRWRLLVVYLRNKYPGYHVVVTGSEFDKDLAKEICRNDNMVINTTGRIQMNELSTLIAHCRLFIGPDSGITHLASTIGKKSVVIGNQSNPTWLPYYNSNAVILFEKKRCTCLGDKSGSCFEEINGKCYYRCMIDIPDEKIYYSCDKILAS